MEPALSEAAHAEFWTSLDDAHREQAAFPERHARDHVPRRGSSPPPPCSFVLSRMPLRARGGEIQGESASICLTGTMAEHLLFPGSKAPATGWYAEVGLDKKPKRAVFIRTGIVLPPFLARGHSWVFLCDNP